MDETKRQGIDLLMGHLNVITSYDPSSLAEGKDLGAINFRSGKPLFEQTIELAKEFSALPLDLLPIETLRSLANPIKNWATGLKQIADFTLVGQANPEAQRNSLLSQAQNYHDQAFTAVTPHLAYLSLKSAQVQETMRRSSELLKETEQKVSAVFKELEHKKKDVDTIVCDQV